MKKAITYYRVSTERQGMSGLGLEAQQKAVQEYIGANSLELAGAFIEIESGKKNNRPILLQALKECKEQQAILIIAKLDRLGRNLAFISKLMESGVDFKAVDNPHASKLIIHIMAAFAEHQRDKISEDTKSALRAAKDRGVILGSYGRNVLSKRNHEAAVQFSCLMKPVIADLQQHGVTTVRKITVELNRLQIPTYRNGGHRWHCTTVHRIMKHLNQLSA